MADLSCSPDLDFDPVAKAAGWAKRLLKWAYEGPGDNVDLAMERAAARAEVPIRVFWSLRYRPPKDLGARVYFALKRTYDAECLRQEARLEADIKITKLLPPTAARTAVVREMEALLRSLRAERDDVRLEG